MNAFKNTIDRFYLDLLNFNQLVSYYLGDKASEKEVISALDAVNVKFARIQEKQSIEKICIKYYLAQLVAEHIQSERFTKMNFENEKRRVTEANAPYTTNSIA